MGPAIRENAGVAGEDVAGLNGTASGAAESISQLLAKILNQLSLSAWLPSAALVLLVAFIVEIGSNLTPPTMPSSLANSVTAPTHGSTKWGVSDVVSRTFSQIGHASFGAITLLIVVIVVATMITQAFSFEAIRFLEGYWGTNSGTDKLAARWARRHRKHQATLVARYEQLIAVAWRDVESAVHNQSPRLTKPMRDKLQERVTGKPARRPLTDEQKSVVAAVDWEALVQADVLRQLRNVEKAMAEYPRDASRIMATRLGNVMRRAEAEAGADDVERLVERVYHSLPFSMQLSHDEQRARLDLYCSMVFVLWFSTLAALARFGWWAWPYAVSFAGVAMLSSIVAYRAAIASARYYGSLLVGIAEWAASAPA